MRTRILELVKQGKREEAAILGTTELVERRTVTPIQPAARGVAG